MINQLSDLFPYILAAALIAVFSSPMLLKACIGIGLLDQPGSAPHKIHTSPVPLAGGLILGLSIFVVFLVSKLAYQSGLLVILIGSELIASAVKALVVLPTASSRSVILLISGPA